MEGQYIALVRSIKKKKSFEMPIYPTSELVGLLLVGLLTSACCVLTLASPGLDLLSPSSSCLSSNPQPAVSIKSSTGRSEAAAFASEAEPLDTRLATEGRRPASVWAATDSWAVSLLCEEGSPRGGVGGVERDEHA
jgi:hypothetical protein